MTLLTPRITVREMAIIVAALEDKVAILDKTGRGPEWAALRAEMEALQEKIRHAPQSDVSGGGRK